MNQTNKEETAVKFEELISKSRERKMISTNSTDEIYQDVLNFVSDNIKIDQVLEEMGPRKNGSNLTSDDLTQMTVESCMAQFQSVSSAVSAPLSLVASQAIAQQLSGLAVLNSNNEAKNCHLLDENVKIKALLLLDLIKKMIAKNSFDKVNFVKCLASKDIPVELVWLLNEESLVSFRSCLLSWYEDENWIEYFCVGVRILCCDECLGTVDLRQKIVQLIIGDLLHMTYGEIELPQKKAKKILFKAMDYVEKEVGKSSSDQSKNWLCLYKVIRDITVIPANTIHTFFHEMLSELLERPCSLTVEEAIACQEKWTYEFLSEATIMKYQQFILVFRNEEVVQIFERAVDSMKTEAVNIQVLSHLLTVFLVYVEDAYKLFDDFLGRCISETFENCDLLQLRVVLLFRRQAALEGNHVSPSYSTWFEKTFVTKGLSLGLNAKRTIQFFFKSLSDLVPYEKPEYLKVHIFKSLHVPIKYKYFVDDYVSLAKTRLADLNEPLEDNAGIFRQCHGNLNDEQVKVMEQAKVDVDKVLKLYEESGKVPTTIMEASIFRKPYFIGRFLPALLIPRKPPSEADVRARLIDDLNRAGKIPDSMLRSYHKKCEKFEDSSSSDTPRDNVQKLVDSLEKLPTLVLDEITGAEAATKVAGLTSWLSVISRKIKLIFASNVPESISEVIDLDLASLNVKDDRMQASYEIMNAFCRTCAAVQNVGTSESLTSNREIVKFRWASRFVSMLLSVARLIESLYVHLWNTVSHEPHLLQDEHIYGLVILVCHLACSKSGHSSIIRLQSTSVAESEYYQSFVDLLSSQIPLISRSSTNFFIRWCCCYLQYAVVAFDIVTTNANQITADSLAGSCYVPEIMVIKVRYLFDKLKFRNLEFKDRVLDEKTWDVLKLVMRSLHDIGILQDLSQVGFRQWLVWELRIKEDFLLENERQQYYNWAIYEHFIPSCSRDEGDSSASYRETASQLFAVLMDHYSSSREIGMNRVHCSTETNLLKILQDIACLIGHNHAKGSTVNSKEETIWLLDCFVSRNNKVIVSGNSSKDLQLCCEIMAFLRLATLLPPWLLTANSEWDSLSEQSTNKLVSFLNNYLKPYMFQETFAFPFDFTAHLLKAFFSSSLKPGTENVRTSEKLFRQLTKATPLFFGSFVHYWEQLKPLCHRYIAHSDVLKQFKSYHIWLNSVFDTKERSHRVTLPEDTGDEPGFAYGIFLYLKRRLQGITSRLVSEISDLLSRMTKLLDSLLDTLRGKKIILYLYDNIMSYLVDVICQGNQIKDEELWVEISMAILSRCPDVLRVFTQGLQEDSELTTVRSLLASKHFCKLLPVIFFRIIVQQPKRKLHQPLDLEFFVEVTRFIKDYFNTVPRTILRTVPEHLIKRSSLEIQGFFSR